MSATETSSTGSCTDTGLTSGTTYWYEVESAYYNSSGPVLWTSSSADSAFSGTTFAADGSGTLTTPTTNVANGSTGNKIVFTYTAATGGISGGEVDIAVPAGWTAPTSSNATGCTTVSGGTLSFSGQTIKVSALTLATSGTLTVTYGATSGGSCGAGDGATAPTTAGSATWQGQEKSTSGGTLANISPSPSIDVYAADGTGTLTTPTTNAAATQTGYTITFTYTAATGGISGGEVDIAVPAGWTAPTSSNAIGCTTVSSGTLSFSGQTIKVSALTLPTSGTLTVTYGATSGGSCSAGDGATATSTLGAQTWQGKEKSTSGGTLTNVSSSPSITVDALPTVSSPTASSPCNPAHNGTTTCSITGTGFQSGVTVTISANGIVNSVTFNSSTSLTINVTGNGGNKSTGNIVVTNPDGGSATVTSGFKNGS